MKKSIIQLFNYSIIQLFCYSIILLFSYSTASAYRIEISNSAIANTSVFLAGYYGDQVSVIDSAMTDAAGKAVFERDDDLCSGMYTLIAPGKLQYDLLLDVGQQLRIEWLATSNARIEGDEPTAAWAAYQTWADVRPDREELIERRRQIIDQYPNTFLAAYLAALQPVEPPDAESTGDMSQLMRRYLYSRRHYFDNMPLSDVRLLRTPVYHETIHYYMTKFVTQQTDTLIHIAYRMLEQASGNYETFFYVSDYLIDFSLRNKIQDINRLHNFLNRNRDMLGTKGIAMLPPRSNINYFKVSDEKLLQNCLDNLSLTGADGQTFNPQTFGSKYRAYYFWKTDCPRCIAGVARWLSVLNRYENRSLSGFAVNVKFDVQLPENRILGYNPLCTNVSATNMLWNETVFFAHLYSKIVLTDNEGNIIGLFASSASLDNFLRIAR